MLPFTRGEFSSGLPEETATDETTTLRPGRGRSISAVAGS